MILDEKKDPSLKMGPYDSYGLNGINGPNGLNEPNLNLFGFGFGNHLLDLFPSPFGGFLRILVL